MLKQTAALSLGALILGSNVLLPCATATTNRPETITTHQAELAAQLGLMTTHQLAMDSRQSDAAVHPMKEKPTMLSMAEWLNPVSLLFNAATSLQTVSTPAVKTAKSVPVKKIAIVAAATPAVEAEPARIEVEKPSKAEMAKMRKAVIKAQRQALKEAKKAAKEKSETLAVQPASQTIVEAPAASTTASPAPAENKEEAKPIQTHQTVIQPADKDEAIQAQPSKPQPQAAPIKPQTPAVARKPVVDKKIVAKAPAKRVTVNPPRFEEAFQMMASTPLEQLAAAAKSAAYGSPKLDKASPDVAVQSAGSNVKVLKSGISQKVTQVDLTVGKAEVIYLNRPAARVSVSNPDVASAVVISPTQVQLVGKAVGVSNLLVWGDMMSPDHTVVDISVHRDVSVLMNQLKYVDPGIQVIPMAAEDTVILTGEAASRESAQIAIEMAKAYFAKNGIGAGPSNGGPSSQAPGSAIPGQTTNVINLIKVKDEPSTKIEMARRKLAEIDPNVKIDVVPGPDGVEKVILTGRVANATIASRALNTASVFYGQPGMKLISAQGGSELAQFQPNGNFSTGSGSGSGGSSGSQTSVPVNMLQGSVMTDATGNVISMLEIAQKPQVRCSIKFLEVKKNGLDSLGHTLSAAMGTAMLSSLSGAQSPAPSRTITQLADTIKTQAYEGNPGSLWGSGFTKADGQGWHPSTKDLAQGFGESYQNGVTQVFTINNKVAGAIQALEERRLTRTLAEPNITVLSGEQGSFLAGGEYPLVINNLSQQTVEYKPFGIRLELLPTVTDDGKLQMVVSPEVSVQSGFAPNGFPVFATNKMQTNLIMEPGQTFMLAGLYSQNDIQSMSGLPGIAKLPILGSFFRNNWKTKEKSELVVLVKPDIIYSETGPTPHATRTGAAMPNNGTQVSRVYDAGQ